MIRESFRSRFLFSSVEYVQYTPSSKRNLSSKIHHKSLSTYCLPLTCLFEKNKYLCNPIRCAGGEMVDALVSGASVNCDV